MKSSELTRVAVLTDVWLASVYICSLLQQVLNSRQLSLAGRLPELSVLVFLLNLLVFVVPLVIVIFIFLTLVSSDALWGVVRLTDIPVVLSRFPTSSYTTP